MLGIEIRNEGLYTTRKEMTRKKKTVALLLFSFLFLFLPVVAGAFSVGSVRTFNVETSYDNFSRNRVSAVLHWVTNDLFYYVEEEWWKGLSDEDRGRLSQRMYNASGEFERNIRPQINSIFGSVPDHPVDKSGRVTVLFHRMPPGVGGYFNTGDQFEVFRSPNSNERNMIYISALHIEGNSLEGLLAHEFMHLVTFNEKERTHRVSEEIWLNEARAEFVPTMLGYDRGGPNSSIARRIAAFSRQPETSLTQWRDLSRNYGVVNLFIHYLVDHYGVEILADSLRSNKVGIESIDEALKKNGHSERFADIFTNWKIAVLVNDCTLGEKYCYLNPAFKDLRLAPSSMFLPAFYGSSFSSRRSLNEWSAIWQRVIGGRGIVTLEFDGDDNLNFKVPYVLCERQDVCEVGFMVLDQDNKGVLTMNNLGDDTSSITFIPSLQTSILGRETIFDWKISTRQADLVNENELIARLVAQIAALRAEVARLQSLISAPAEVSCVLIGRNLSFGASGADTTCLQEFLRNQGPGIYPEGLITGRFLSLTRNAVIRFQERHASEILAPLGLKRGTGRVGELTRRKINEILNIR